MVDAHRDWYQRRWTATVRHLICVSNRRMSLDGRDRHRNTSTTVEVDWRQVYYEVVSALSCLHSLALAKLSLVTFSVAEPANWLYYYAALLPRRGRILRRTLSVCLSVRPVIVTERHLAPPSELQWHVLFGTRWGPHIVRPSRPHRFLLFIWLIICMFLI